MLLRYLNHYNLLVLIFFSFDLYFFPPVQLDACNRVSPAINIECSVQHCCASLCLPPGEMNIIGQMIGEILVRRLCLMHLKLGFCFVQNLGDALMS